MVALVVAVLAVSFVVADRRSRRALATGVAVVLVAAVVVVALDLRGESAGSATSGRFGLAKSTWAVFTDHPGVGVGVGAQPLASREETGRRAEASASHTTPLTVAAELGVLGLLAYAAFLVGSARTALLAARRELGVGVVLGAAFLLLVVHSLFYAGFYENPAVWAAVALAAAVATRAGGGDDARAAIGAARS
jgi:hypothetical protein